MPQATGLQFTATLGQLPKDLFVVARFELTEYLSRLCYCKLELASTSPDIAPEDVLEQPVELVMWQDGVPLRRFTGVINEFVRGDSGHRRKGPAENFGMTSRSIWMDGFWPCAKKKVCHMSPQKGRQKSVNEMIRTLPDYHGHSRRRS